MPRFGPQSSANLRLVQNVFSAAERSRAHPRAPPAQGGRLAEHYQDNMVNPTFSLGIYTFREPEQLPAQPPQRFIGLTPEAQLDRYWRFTLFGVYAAGRLSSVTPRLTRERGSALRVRDAAGGHVRPRLRAAEPQRTGADRRPALREPDLHEPVAARRASPGTCSATAARRCAAATGCTSTPTTSRT